MPVPLRGGDGRWRGRVGGVVGPLGFVVGQLLFDHGLRVGSELWCGLPHEDRGDVQGAAVFRPDDGHLIKRRAGLDFPNHFVREMKLFMKFLEFLSR